MSNGTELFGSVFLCRKIEYLPYQNHKYDYKEAEGIYLELLLIISGVFLSVSAVAILLLSFYCGKPIKYLLLNALLGL